MTSNLDVAAGSKKDWVDRLRGNQVLHVCLINDHCYRCGGGQMLWVVPWVEIHGDCGVRALVQMEPARHQQARLEADHRVVGQVQRLCGRLGLSPATLHLGVHRSAPEPYLAFYCPQCRSIQGDSQPALFEDTRWAIPDLVVQAGRGTVQLRHRCTAEGCGAAGEESALLASGTAHRFKSGVPVTEAIVRTKHQHLWASMLG